MSRRALVLVVALAACGKDTKEPFQLSNAHASVFLGFADATTTTSPIDRVSLQLEPNGGPSAFDGARADIDGTALATTSSGGNDGTVPTWFTEKAPAPEPSTAFHATDGQVSMTMRVDNLLAPRAFSVIGSADGKLHAGAALVLQWSPPTDALQYVAVVLRPTDGSAPFQAKDARVDGSRITFTVPAGRAGPVVLAVTTAVTMPVRECTGVAGCDASTSNLTVALPAELAP